MDEARVQKVQALLNKAERTDNEAEAEVFFAKAQELMTLWAIDDLMLAAANTGKDLRDEVVRKDITLGNSYFKATMELVFRIAEANDVKMVYVQPRTGHPGIVKLVGFKTDVEHTEFLFTSLLVQMTREVRRARKPADDWSSDYVFKNTFRFAYARRIGRRMQDAKRDARAEAAKTRGTGMELALRDKSAMVQQIHDEMFPNLRSAPASRRDYSSAGAAAGSTAADRADLGQRRVGGRRSIT